MQLLQEETVSAFTAPSAGWHAMGIDAVTKQLMVKNSDGTTSLAAQENNQLAPTAGADVTVTPTLKLTTLILTGASVATFAAGAMTGGLPGLVVTSTTGMTDGMPITGTGIPTGTTILSITNGTTAVMSQNASTTESGETITVGQLVATLNNGNNPGDTALVFFLGGAGAQNIVMENAATTVLAKAVALGSGAYAAAFLVWSGAAWDLERCTLNGAPASLVAGVITAFIEEVELSPAVAATIAVAITSKVTSLVLNGYSASSTATLANGNTAGDSCSVTFYGSASAQNIILQNASSATLCEAALLGSGQSAWAALKWSGTAWVVNSVTLDGSPASLVAGVITAFAGVSTYITKPATKAITNITVANPAVVTVTNHGFVIGDAVSVTLSGNTTTPTTNGTFTATVLTANTFSVPVHTTGVTSFGTMANNTGRSTGTYGSGTLDPDLQFTLAANQSVRATAWLNLGVNNAGGSGNVGLVAPSGCKVTCAILQTSSETVAGIGGVDALHETQAFFEVDGASLSSNTVALANSGESTLLMEFTMQNGSTPGAAGIAFVGNAGGGSEPVVMGALSKLVFAS